LSLLPVHAQQRHAVAPVHLQGEESRVACADYLEIVRHETAAPKARYRGACTVDAVRSWPFGTVTSTSGRPGLAPYPAGAAFRPVEPFRSRTSRTTRAPPAAAPRGRPRTRDR